MPKPIKYEIEVNPEDETDFNIVTKCPYGYTPSPGSTYIVKVGNAYCTNQKVYAHGNGCHHFDRVDPGKKTVWCNHQ